MKTFLLSACMAGLLAVATLPAAAGQGQGDHDRPNPSQRHYVDNNWDDDWDDEGRRWRKHRDRYWPRYGQACGGWHHPRGWTGAYGYHPPMRLPKPLIERCVRHYRFSHVKEIDFDDGFYKVHARDPYGRKVKLLVDPYTGSIVRVKRR